MELNKIIEKSRDYPNKIKTALKKDIDSIINILVENFDIYQRDSKSRVTKDELNSILTKNLKQEESTCCAITKNGLRCLKKSFSDSKYCKIHYNKGIMYHTTLSNNEYVDETIVLFKNDKSDNKLDDILKNGKSIFIDDSFYLVDSMFIYDKDSYEKVGYVSDNNEYILTDDPFILGV